MRKQSLFQGAFVLTAAAFVTKILGFATTVIQSRILGAEGIGLQMMVTPFIGLMMTVTTLGLPVAISKAVAEAEAKQDKTKIKRILLISLLVTISLSLVLTFALLYFGKAFAARFLADQRAYYSLMALAPVIPLLAISGVLRGYFQGRQNMNPLAISQIIEQIVRIVSLYVLVQLLIPRGIEYAAAGAVAASVIGELAYLLYLSITFRLSSNYHIDPPKLTAHLSRSKTHLMELFKTGLPQTGTQFFRSLLRVIQPIVITQALMRTGLDTSAIATQFGMLTGYVYPLLFFPGFVNYSLAVALVPAVSEANSRNKIGLVHQRISQAVKTSLLIGVPSSAILFIFSNQLLTYLYKAPEAATLLRLTAPFFLLQYFHSPMQSALVGLGHASKSMINNIIPRCLGLALIFPLAVYLDLGIKGIALAASISVVLETVMHYLSLLKLIGPCFRMIDIVKIVAIGIVIAFFTAFTFDTLLLYRLNQMLAMIITVIINIFLYFSLILLTKTLRWAAVITHFRRK